MALTANLTQRQNNKNFWILWFRWTFTFLQWIQTRQVIIQLLKFIISFSKSILCEVWASFTLNLDFQKRPSFREILLFLHWFQEERLLGYFKAMISVSSYLALSCLPQTELTGRSHLSKRMHYQGDWKPVDKYFPCHFENESQLMIFCEATWSEGSYSQDHLTHSALAPNPTPGVAWQQRARTGYCTDSRGPFARWLPCWQKAGICPQESLACHT